MYSEFISGIVALVLIVLAVVAQRKNLSIRDMVLGKGESGFEARVETFAAISTVVEILYLANQGMERGMTASNAYMRFGMLGIMEILFAYNVAHFISKAVSDGVISVKEIIITFLLYMLSFAWTSLIFMLYLEAIDVIIITPGGINTTIDSRIEIGATALIFSTQILSIFTVMFGVRRAKRIREKMKSAKQNNNPAPKPSAAAHPDPNLLRQQQSQLDKTKNLDNIVEQGIRDENITGSANSITEAKQKIAAYLNKYLTKYGNNYTEAEVLISHFEPLTEKVIMGLYKFAYLGGLKIEEAQIQPEEKAGKHKSKVDVTLQRLGILEKKQPA